MIQTSPTTPFVHLALTHRTPLGAASARPRQKFEKAETRATKSLLSTPPEGTACVVPAFQPPQQVMTAQRHQPHASESAMMSIQRAESERAGGGRGCGAERAHGRTTCDAPARLRAKGGLLGCLAVGSNESTVLGASNDGESGPQSALPAREAGRGC